MSYSTVLLSNLIFLFFRNHLNTQIAQCYKIVNYRKNVKFISNGKYENQQNCQCCGISNDQTIPKFVNF